MNAYPLPALQNYKITITDSYNDVFELSFTRNQYPNLMTLIAANYPEEFGACKGLGLCGTCHVKIASGNLNEPIRITEEETLKNLYDTESNSRLACQIMLDEKINNMTFKIINE